MSSFQSPPSLRNKKPPIKVKTSADKQSFLSKSVPMYLFLFTLIAFLTSSFLYFRHITKSDSVDVITDLSEVHDPKVKVVREKGQNLTNALLFVEIESEQTLDPLKLILNNYIAQKRQENAIRSVSVYVKDLNASMYLAINSDSLYDPASLLKVPMLILYLKQVEKNPNLLSKSFVFKKNPQNKTVETITDKTLIDGKSYSVEQLLYYMIVYSDNEAFWILCDNIDENIITEFDKKLSIPSNIDITHFARTDKHYITNVNSVAHYFNVLYNASYIDNNMSNYALNLLCKTTFRGGILQGIPPKVIVAHKFGERTLSYQIEGRVENLQSEFHEFGIVYLKNKPYIIGVMTRGQDSEKLQNVVADISKIVYDEFSH